MAEDGIEFRRLYLPAWQAFAVIIASISVFGSLFAIWTNFIERLEKVETVISDNGGVWTRTDQTMFCLRLALANPEFKCPDPMGQIQTVNRDHKQDRR